MTVALALIVSVLIFSCKKDDEPENLITSHNVPEEEEECNVTYSNGIELILDSYCTNCHGGVYPPDLRGYNNAKQWGDRIQRRAVVNGNMPPAGNGAGSLTESEKEAINCWIEKGTP